MERNLTSIELAAMFNRTQLTIYNWIKRGVPHETIMDGMLKVYRFNEEEVRKWLLQTQTKK